MRSRAEIESPRARASFEAGCEFSPATLLRVPAHPTYFTSYRLAYGHWRTAAAALHRTSSAMFPQPRTFRLGNPGLSFDMASRAGTSNRLHQTSLSFPTESPLAPNYAGQRDEPRQDKQSRRPRSATHPTMHAVARRRTKITDVNARWEQQCSTTCMLQSRFQCNRTSIVHFKHRMKTKTRKGAYSCR